MAVLAASPLHVTISDLIWNGSHSVPRANRAAVAIVFDNTPGKAGGGSAAARLFPKLDFDEVTIERAVYRDGSSEYSINNSKARLRDIQELLATANIGQSVAISISAISGVPSNAIVQISFLRSAP